MNVLTVSIILSSVIAISGKAVHNYDYPHYAFNYAVNDPLTKDNKEQWEERDGDQVKGGYSVLEPDGKLRVVEYFANDLTGFHAVVKKFEHDQVPVVHEPLSHSKYGFGAAPFVLDLPKVTLRGTSLPWNSERGSYGGWVPLDKGVHVRIIRKKYVNGLSHKSVIGPIYLPGKKNIIKKRVP